MSAADRAVYRWLSRHRRAIARTPSRRSFQVEVTEAFHGRLAHYRARTIGYLGCDVARTTGLVLLRRPVVIISGDRAAFLAAIENAPQDDLPWLVYADWLAEHDDPDQEAYVRALVAGTGRVSLSHAGDPEAGTG